MKIKEFIIGFIRSIILRFLPEINVLNDKDINLSLLRNKLTNVEQGTNTKFYSPYKIIDSSIGDYTYIAPNCSISLAKIGRFCSIGPNFLCGWGIHPINGISTSPMFYSTMKQNGITLTTTNKVKERDLIEIGNDVFIGMNVTVLDGIKIGDGAIIGAGAVVSKDIPPYSIAVGNPIKVIRNRFNPDTIEELIRIKWWDFDEEKLKTIEENFFDIKTFIENNKH